MLRFEVRWLLLTCLSACVIGRPLRPAQHETTQGPLAPAVSGAPVVPTTTAAASEQTPEKAKPGAIWVRGYWHWDGVRYVWQRGRWETAPLTASE